jgi:hypothetical protein
VAELAPDGQLIHLSVMLGRAAQIKLYVSIPSARLDDYLTALGSGGTYNEMRQVVADTFPRLDPIFLDLTISDAVAPRLGLAFSQLHLRRGVGAEPTWAILFAELVRRGACDERKRQALASWPGTQEIRFAGQKWPTRLHRYLDVKLVSEPGQPLRAKAYLGFRPHAPFV